jgi:hypothetical protein
LSSEKPLSDTFVAVTGLSWNWIALMATAPFIVGCAVAFPVWKTKQFVLGNLAGTAVIVTVALALILRESAEIDRITRRCLEAGITCWPTPSGFTRYAIYAGIGLIESIALFMLSLNIERRIRNEQYAPEWRS